MKHTKVPHCIRIDMNHFKNILDSVNLAGLCHLRKGLCMHELSEIEETQQRNTHHCQVPVHIYSSSTREEPFLERGGPPLTAL